MRMLIIHTLNFQRVNYPKQINHSKHAVTYIGYATAMCNIPDTIPAKKISIPANCAKLEFLEQYLGDNQPYDAIIALSEYDLMIAAKLRCKFNIPGKKPESAVLFTEKIQMKNSMVAHKIKVPHYLSGDAALKYQADPWQKKTVLKPIDGCGSKDVMVFDTFNLARDYFIKNIVSIENCHNYQFEEYIPGNIIHFDGVINEGKLVCVIAGQYINTCLDYVAGKPYASIQLPASFTPLDWLERCLAAAKIQQGIFNLEAIATCNNELVFLEVAHRIGGGGIAETYQLATGVNLLEFALHAALTEAIPNVETDYIPPWTQITRHEDYFGFFLLPGHHLQSEEYALAGLDKFLNHKNIAQLFQQPKNQVTTQISYSLDSVPLAGLLRGDSPEELSNFIRHLFSTITLTKRNKNYA